VTLENFRTIKEQGCWGAYATFLLNERTLTPLAKAQFGTYWIEAGHHIREQIADDRLLVRLLRHLLPPYEGEAIELFRGENRNRWESKIVGLAWTANADTARMFGRGLNAVGAGGVLLRAHFEPEAIICGPNAHSSYLDENQFTVEPFAGTAIAVVEFYPAIT
jgi:hypothetical protein